MAVVARQYQGAEVCLDQLACADDLRFDCCGISGSRRGAVADPYRRLRSHEGEWIAGDHIARSEEHTSELQSLMRISYAVFCLKKKKPIQNYIYHHKT